jgi:hypothetical protein
MTTPTAPRGAVGAAVSSSRRDLGFDGLVFFVFGVNFVLVMAFMFVGVVDLAVMFSMELAGFFGVMGGVSGMTSRDMGMMTRRFGVARFMMGGGFTVMLGRVIMMISGMGVVFVGGESLGHVNILSKLGAKPKGSRSEKRR